MEFWEISGREEDEKRGFGHSGITPKMWGVSGRQEYRKKDTERGDRDSSTCRKSEEERDSLMFDM